MAGGDDARRALVLRAISLFNETVVDPARRIVPSDDELDAEDQLAGILTDFARAPRKLHALLDDVPDGPEVARRILRVARAAGPGVDRDRGTFDLYLVVRRPEALPRATAEQVIRKHYRSMIALARELGEEPEEVRADVPITWGAPPPREGWHDTAECLLSEIVGDRIHSLNSEHPILGLGESAYALAASYELQRYVLWPAHREHIETPDPYRHWARLWMHGIQTCHLGSSIRASEDVG